MNRVLLFVLGLFGDTSNLTEEKPSEVDWSLVGRPKDDQKTLVVLRFAEWLAGATGDNHRRP